jgi:hypothetical protein
MRVRSSALAVIVLLAAVGVTGCGGDDGPASFVGRASNAAVLVKWARSGDDLSGALTQARIDASDPYAVATDHVGFTGKIDGSAVSLRLSQGLGIETTLTGKLAGSDLALDFPGEDGEITTVRFRKATADDYNIALAALRERARQAKTEADQAQAEATATQDAQASAEAVRADLDALQRVTSGASSDAAGRYSDVLDQIRTDLGAVKKDTQMALSDASRNADATCSDAGTVSSDLGTIESDIGTLESEQGSTDGTTTSINEAIKRLRDDFEALQSFDPRYLPPDAPDRADLDAAINDARREARNAASSAGGPIAEAQRILETARSYEAQANAACDRLGE